MSKKPRLVVVTGTFPAMVCGTSPWIAEILSRLVKRNVYDIAVLTSCDPAVDEKKAVGFRLHPEVGRWDVLAVGGLCRRILALEPDVIYIQNPTIKYRRWNSFTLSVLVPWLKRQAPQVRVVVMQHDLAVAQRWLRWRYYPLLRCADAVLVTNSRDAQAVGAMGIASSKLYRVPLSTFIRLPERTAESRRAGRQAMGIPADALCVAYFGFMVPGRNVDVLVRALGRLQQGGRQVYGLMMGGPHAYAPGYYDECRRLAQELGLAEHICWTGYATDEQVADGLAGADVFVSLLSRGADMRNSSILTGLLAGLPVITSRNPRYYVDEELEGFGCRCVGPRDVAAVAQAIEEAAANPPTEQEQRRRREWLDPERVWTFNIDNHLRAFRGIRHE